MSTGNSQLPARLEERDCPVDVVVPTRDRPEKLLKCLTGLAEARYHLAATVYVADSSTTDAARHAVDEICERFPFVHLHRHNRVGLAQARNECTRVATKAIIVTVDDDVYVTPTALDELWNCYRAATGWRVVAGSVAWGHEWSGPISMRRIGYGRRADPTEADFYVTALMLYPKALVMQLPFNEGLPSGEDRFAGALWRGHDVRLLWAPEARAFHDDEHTTGLFTAYHQRALIYTNLFDAILVRTDFGLAACFEVLGFLAGLRRYIRSAKRQYLRSWLCGHYMLLRDWRALKQLVSVPLRGDPSV